MASSLQPERNYDVFLSFRGEDIRNNFVGHLWKALDGAGVRTFIDSKELRKGDGISPSIARAIEGSRITVVVFSENYASSPWCLEELVQILECKKMNEQVVMPVFYKVEPRKVRGRHGSYGTALAMHGRKYGKGSERVKKWREALAEAANLSGWHLDNGDESSLIESITREISVKLGKVPLHVAKHPVGIEYRVEKVKSLLRMELSDAHMAGIWGTGGIGKTTIAKAVYNSLIGQFANHCFLHKVGETSKNLGLVHLQKELLREMLGTKDLEVPSVDAGINLIRDRLCCKKVLLVLDDVTGMDQLDALAGECNWFSKGSRVIITTRDKHLLNSHGVNEIYEVKPLNHTESLELLSCHAFPKGAKMGISRDLVDGVLRYANGLPLALVVLGSFLHGRSKEQWKSALNKLAEHPNEMINNVLKISFEALDDQQKEIFLDIGCFFVGKDHKYVNQVLDACGFEPIIDMQVLVERSLISIERGKIQMHDLLQLMAKDSVYQECPEEPSRRSRLWSYDDVREVLASDTVIPESTAIKAIGLSEYNPEEDLLISPASLANLKRLRLLILRNACFPNGSEQCLAPEVRWFEWLGYTSAIFPTFRNPEKLVGLHMWYSLILELGSEFKNLRNLKYVNFGESGFLKKFPDISKIPNVESLKLHGCVRLVEIHESVGQLEELVELDLESCLSLETCPSTLKSKYYKFLRFESCSRLAKFPTISTQMEALQMLSLNESGIEELPDSIRNLVSLVALFMDDCKELSVLPSSIHSLQALKHMSANGCSKLRKFPRKMENDSVDPDCAVGLPSLIHLSLSNCSLSEVEFLMDLTCFSTLSFLSLAGNAITTLPACISKFDELSVPDLSNCEQLQRNFEPPRLLWLSEVELGGNYNF
ncbi:disease resistance protein Roq1-like [Rhodamnia argentea]|uniref:Disease resistance protein Roq1-like n=1 Tax=Rhodamnia argentea TaxID=178133 RepID=A0A8B8QZL1_9MYRT|nr:disease resistance protein Roq1-like [Rhodamnia argentea]